LVARCSHSSFRAEKEIKRLKESLAIQEAALEATRKQLQVKGGVMKGGGGGGDDDDDEEEEEEEEGDIFSSSAEEEDEEYEEERKKKRKNDTSSNSKSNSNNTKKPRKNATKEKFLGAEQGVFHESMELALLSTCIGGFNCCEGCHERFAAKIKLVVEKVGEKGEKEKEKEREKENVMEVEEEEEEGEGEGKNKRVQEER